MDILACSLQTSRDHYAWIGTLELADEGEFNALQVGGRLSLALAADDDQAETWVLIIDSLQRDEALGSVRLLVRVISPSALLAGPWAATVDATWTGATAASAIADALVPGVTWSVLDWTVAPGRFSVAHQTPLEALGTLAEAVGAMIRSRPLGGIDVVPRVPTPVAAWPTAAVAATLSDDEDVITRSGSGAVSETFNHITVTDGVSETTTTGLVLSLDDRPRSGNQGRSEFAAGETAHLLLWHAPGVAIALDATAGQIDMDDAASSDWVTETIEFREASEASVSRPIAGIGGVQWLGRNGGNLTLRDRNTVGVSAPITGLARLTYAAHYHTARITLPDTVTDADEFEVMVVASAPDTVTQGVSVTVARGTVSGDPITDPLCCTTAAATARANSALDDATRFTRYTIESVYRPGLLPGDLIEVAEARSGDTWRGMIDSIEHRLDAGRLTTLLDLLRA